GHPTIRLVGRVGSAHSVSNAKVSGSRLTFNDGPGQWEIDVQDRKLAGHSPAGQLTGVPAPRLAPKAVNTWSNPEPLFDGRDLSGWEPDNPAANHWMAENGELRNIRAG